MTRLLRLLACGMMLLTHATAAPPADPAGAFEAFQGFQGRWAIHSGGKTLPFEMTYDIGSKGSIVTEQFGKELSVVYRDGPSLLLTHFCNAGNQPRLRLKESSSPGSFEFEMFDITNLSPTSTEAHVQRILYRRIDDKHLELEIVWKRGTSEDSEKYTLTRI